MSAADVIQRRKRATASFDPTNEPGATLLGWWSARRATVDGSGNILTVPSSGGSVTGDLTRASGSVGPIYAALDTVMASKPSAQLPYDGATDRRMVTPAFPATSLFTVVFIGAQYGTVNTTRFQYVWNQGGRHVVGTANGAAGDDLLGNNGTQLYVGSVFRNTGPACLVLTGGGGAANYFCWNSTRPDIVADFGSQDIQAGGVFTIGGHYGTAITQAFGGCWSEFLVYSGIASLSFLGRVMRWAQRQYRMSLSSDVPGTIFRARDYFYTNGGQASADGFYFPFYTPVESMVAESGSLRAYTAVDGTAEDVARGVVQNSISQGSTWWSGRSTDGRHQIKTAAVDLRSLLGHGGPGTPAKPRRNESFTIMGAGLAPRFFWRDDQSLPFVEAPYEAADVVPAFAPTGKIDVGGNRVNSPTLPIVGAVRELATLREGAWPMDLKLPNYAAGSMIFYGHVTIAALSSGHWPIRAVQQNLAAGRYSYPRPRQVDYTSGGGSAWASWTTIGARFATDCAPFLVSGGANYVCLDAAYGDIYNEGKTTAQAITALNATVNALKTSYGGSPYNIQIAVCTMCPCSFVADATRTAYNALITGASSPPWDIIVDMGAVTPFVNVDGQSKPDGETGILMGIAAGTALASWFST